MTDPAPHTRTFTVAELQELDVDPYTALANIEGEAHRWYTIRHLVFEHDGRHWMVDYMEPASESQEGQDVWSNGDDPEDTVEAIEVHQVPRTTMHWLPLTSDDGTVTEPDPFVTWLVDDLTNSLNEMNDGGTPGGKEAPFGLYPDLTIDRSAGTILVRPGTDPDHWDLTDFDDYLDDDPLLPEIKIDGEKGYPLGPVARITIERVDP